MLAVRPERGVESGGAELGCAGLLGCGQPRQVSSLLFLISRFGVWFGCCSRRRFVTERERRREREGMREGRREGGREGGFAALHRGQLSSNY